MLSRVGFELNPLYSMQSKTARRPLKPLGQLLRRILYHFKNIIGEVHKILCTYTIHILTISSYLTFVNVTDICITDIVILKLK